MDVRTDMDLAEEIFETATPKTDVYRLDAAWSDRFGIPSTSTRALSSPYITFARPASRARSSSWRRASTTTTA